jgi:hypothetical protein
MAKNSKIEWTIYSDTIWFSNTKVQVECEGSYEFALAKRAGNDKPKRKKKKSKISTQQLGTGLLKSKLRII